MKILEGLGVLFLLSVIIIVTTISVEATPMRFLPGEGIYFTDNISLQDTINTNITPDTQIHHEIQYTSYIDKVTRQKRMNYWGGTEFDK